MSPSSSQSKNHRRHSLKDILSMVARPTVELWTGFRARSLPVSECSVAGILCLAAIAFKFDLLVWQKAGIYFLYPKSLWWKALYSLVCASIGFIGWSCYRAGLYHRFKQNLLRAFESSGLCNRLGNFPKLLSDDPLDSKTRKLTVTNAALPKESFEKAKTGLEAALRVYVDDIKEHRTRGTIDIVYARTPMPSKLDWSETHIKTGGFYVGQSRSLAVFSKLSDCPHLLVAGQTGGGKSTFLRQFITSLYLADSKADFTLIDLKSGLEFQLFEGLERATIVPDIKTACTELGSLAKELGRRMTELKRVRAKDIEAYGKLKSSKNPPKDPIAMNRRIVVVDEASDLFLSGSHASNQEIQKAREVLSKIARQGRAAGLHLVIATQRPDSKALDPQVKANLTGVVCFQMVNDASSMVVLGCGRATDLPAIPGRAIWKSGAQMLEVQTPFMSSEESEQLLDPYRTATPEPKATTSETIEGITI